MILLVIVYILTVENLEKEKVIKGRIINFKEDKMKKVKILVLNGIWKKRGK